MFPYIFALINQAGFRGGPEGVRPLKKRKKKGREREIGRAGDVANSDPRPSKPFLSMYSRKKKKC